MPEVGSAAVTATPATRYDRPFKGQVITCVDVQRAGEAALNHHLALAHPTALGQFGLVDRGRLRVAPFRKHRVHSALGPQNGKSDRKWPAVANDTGTADQRGDVCEPGEVGGCSAAKREGRGQHVRTGRRLPGALVWPNGHSVEDEPERQSGRGGHDDDQQHHCLTPVPPYIAAREPAYEEEPARCHVLPHDPPSNGYLTDSGYLSDRQAVTVPHDGSARHPQLSETASAP
jgi:hypothetical protein